MVKNVIGELSKSVSANAQPSDFREKCIDIYLPNAAKEEKIPNKALHVPVARRLWYAWVITQRFFVLPSLTLFSLPAYRNAGANRFAEEKKTKRINRARKHCGRNYSSDVWGNFFDKIFLKIEGERMKIGVVCNWLEYLMKFEAWKVYQNLKSWDSFWGF